MNGRDLGSVQSQCTLRGNGRFHLVLWNTCMGQSERVMTRAGFGEEWKVLHAVQSATLSVGKVLWRFSSICGTVRGSDYMDVCVLSARALDVQEC